MRSAPLPCVKMSRLMKSPPIVRVPVALVNEPSTMSRSPVVVAYPPCTEKLPVPFITSVPKLEFRGRIVSDAAELNTCIPPFATKLPPVTESDPVIVVVAPGRVILPCVIVRSFPTARLVFVTVHEPLPFSVRL